MSLWGLSRALLWFDSEMEESWNRAGFQSRDMVSSDLRRMLQGTERAEKAPGHLQRHKLSSTASST